jgi:hypothetical protein
VSLSQKMALDRFLDESVQSAVFLPRGLRYFLTEGFRNLYVQADYSVSCHGFYLFVARFGSPRTSILKNHDRRGRLTGVRQ